MTRNIDSINIESIKGNSVNAIPRGSTTINALSPITTPFAKSIRERCYFIIFLRLIESEVD